jgi:hypothetical protein
LHDGASLPPAFRSKIRRSLCALESCSFSLLEHPCPDQTWLLQILRGATCGRAAAVLASGVGGRITHSGTRAAVSERALNAALRARRASSSSEDSRYTACTRHVPGRRSQRNDTQRDFRDHDPSSDLTLTSCRCGGRGARPWQRGARARAGGAGGAARGRHSPTLAGRGAAGGAGRLASSTPRITSPTRWESGAAGACAGGARGGLRLSRCAATAVPSTRATAPAATPAATRSAAPLLPRSHANAPPSGDSGPPGDLCGVPDPPAPAALWTRRVRSVRKEGRDVSG